MFTVEDRERVRDHVLARAALITAWSAGRSWDPSRLTKATVPSSHGRGFDDLPSDLRDPFGDALVRSLDRTELTRALDSAIANLMNEGRRVQTLGAKLEPQLRALAALGT